MDQLSANDRFKLENKLMQANSDFLDGLSEDQHTSDSDSASQLSSKRNFHSISMASGKQADNSKFAVTRTSELIAELESLKKRNALQRHIDEQQLQLTKMKLAMAIEQDKAQRAGWSNSEHSLCEPSTSHQRNDHDSARPKTNIYEQKASNSHEPKDDKPNEPKDETQKTSNDSCDLLRRMHLPKMAMETFDGEIMKYGSFVRQFENNISSRTCDDEERLYYLEQMTIGKPREIVRTCLHLPPGEGFREARRLLDKRYGDKSKIATALVTKIIDWPCIDTNDVDGLDEFAIFLRGCLNSLKSIPNGLAEADARVIRHILRRLPQDATEKWRDAADSLESRNKVPDFEEFVLFVEKLARIAGNTWFGKQLFTVSPEQGRPISGKSHPSKRSMMVTAMAGCSSQSHSTCVYCSGTHDTTECEEFAKLSNQEKQRFIMKFGLCYGCLTKGHLSATCTQRKNCRLCKGRHPTSLHRNDLGKRDEGVVSLHACPTLVAVEGSNLHVVPLLVTLGLEFFTGPIFSPNSSPPHEPGSKSIPPQIQNLTGQPPQSISK